MAESTIELSHIAKSFGGVPALQDVSITFKAGEVHGLVGENGAGKSTLINIATGVLRPDQGAIRLSGHPITLSDARDATRRGIAVVHQEADLFPQLSIAENMLLARGLVRARTGLIQWPATYRRAAQLMDEVGESFDVRATAGGLSVARRMMAEIAAAVSWDPVVLFLDEPTSALSMNEIRRLFGQIRALSDAGVAIVYVSHRLEEVLEICGRVTVLRDGRLVATQPASELTMDQIVSAMVGRELAQMYAKREVPIRDVRLEVAGATAKDGAFKDVSFSVRAGEIMGMYGFVGAGRSEIGQALFGLRRLSEGKVLVDGKDVSARSPRDAVRSGIAYVPEDRLVQGIFRGQSVRANATVAMLRKLSTLGCIRSRREVALATAVVDEMRVRTSSIEQPIATLSGGNQQKVAFGRWQCTAPKVLILDEPTRGVDIGAKAEIHRLICDLAEKGTAILLISSELPEVMAMSDRVIAVSEGRITATLDPARDGEKAVATAAVPKGTQAEAAAPRSEPKLLKRLLHLRELGLIGFIAVLSVGMTLVAPGKFATVPNFLDILSNAALPAMVAQGAMLIICAGGIDISVGSMLGLVGAMAAMAATAGAPPWLCLLLAVSAGVCLSLINAGTSLLARIHPIIVTLAGISIYRGLMRVVTSNREIMNLPAGYRALADGRVFGIPKICYYVVAVTVLVHLLLRYTLWGRRVLALGNSESAGRQIGLSKARLTLFVFAVSGALVGLAAVLHAGYYGKVQANTGEGMELKAIAAAVIGGTNILGGRGSAPGTLLGAFLVALLYNVLILADISSYWQNLFVGALILGAVVVDVLLNRLRGAGS